ncbi:stage V sporulation protein B [Anaerobacterium chartisolvens]|uniref:Stage V sporulation protein B n=1 Tax=Anaerobacterium chartisolvens TaxID=1297424 RepID=A0A369BJR3_9FIRM|nr:polysaccharide biosynthesis protein [Anaerobacterium chartisolvens]RCX19934.1 stage V sporulation protein B [Anaerobacterium chartisolvens]
MKEQSVGRGFAVLSVAGIVVKILSLLYIPFLLAIIGEEGNGIYAAAYQVYVLVYVISNSGVPVAISKLVSELRAVGNYKDAVKSFKIARFFLITLGIIMFALMFAFAAPISRLLHFEKSYYAILVLSPTLLFASVSSAYRGYFQGMGNMTPTAVSQIIEQVVNTVFTLVFAALLLKYGLEAACAGGTIGTSLGALFSAIFLVVFHKKRPVNSNVQNVSGVKARRYSYKQLARKVISYSLPITLCIGMQYAGNLVDLWNTKTRLLAAGFTDERATELYSYLYKYQQLLNAPLALTVALSAAILPAISAAVALKDRDQIQQKTKFAFKLCFLVTIPSAAGFSVLSSQIFELLKYGPGDYLMEMGSVALVMLAFIQIQTSILQGAGKLYTVTMNLIFGVAAKIVTNYFLISIPDINVKGAIAGSIAGYCVSITLNHISIRRSLKTPIRPFMLLTKPLIASAVMGVAVYFIYKLMALCLLFVSSEYAVNFVASLISIAAGAIVYFSVLVLIKGVSREELDIIPKRIYRYIPGTVMSRIRSTISE